MKYSFLKPLAGNFKQNPRRAKLGWYAEELIWQAFEELPAGTFVDCHVHLMGLGAGGTGCWMNPGILSWRHPLDHLKVMMYINASAIDDMRFADQQYMQRFLIQVNNFPFPAKFMLLALDGVYSKKGELSHQDTKIYVPMTIYIKSLNRIRIDSFLVFQYIPIAKMRWRSWRNGQNGGCGL